MEFNYVFQKFENKIFLKLVDSIRVDRLFVTSV